MDYSLEIEKSYHAEGSECEENIVGIDEAGRGPLAGPVVAAAVVVDRKYIFNEVNDSKKLSKNKRSMLFEKITSCYHYGVGIANVQEIDELNILQATKLAMIRAVEKLKIKPSHLLIDGNQKLATIIPQTTVVKGDQKIYSIACASIIAKVFRDQIMEDLHNDFPHYGWNKNAGYGTNLQLEAIAKYGITKHHRRSFAPIKERLLLSAELL